MSAEPPDDNEPLLPFSNEQLGLPFEEPPQPPEPVEDTPLIPPDAEFPPGSLVRRKARELFACGWTIRQIVQKLRVFPECKDLTEVKVDIWRRNDDWAEFKKKVEQELAKEQLKRLKETGAKIFSYMDQQICSVQEHLLKALEGRSPRNKRLMKHPPRLTDAKEIHKLLLQSIDSRRALVSTALTSVSESLPLVEPSELEFMTHTTVRIKKPPELPKGEADADAVEQVGKQESTENADGGGKEGGGTPSAT